MRREFRKKLAKHPELLNKIQIVANNAARFKLPRSFSVAYLSGTFDHFVDEDQRKSSLENIARHLDQGGKLVFDVFLGLMRDSQLSPAGMASVGNRVVRRLVGAQVLPTRQQMFVEIVYEIYKNEQLIERIEEKSLVGIIDRNRLNRILDETGFEIRNEWGGYDLEPYVDGDSLLLIEAVMKALREVDRSKSMWQSFSYI
jgi:SAM-dependent methyltransferase